MTNHKKPYIGVTGFMTRGEVLSVLEVVPHDSEYALMVGVLMNEKTINGLPHKKWPNRYPLWGEVTNIFVDDPRVLNLVHYNTPNPETLSRQLLEIVDLCPSIDGFQLNIPWPSIDQLERYWNVCPEKRIVLQIGPQAMCKVSLSSQLVSKVEDYGPLIDTVLVDGSGGTGKPLDATLCGNYLRALQKVPNVTLAVAGGLGPCSLNLLGDLVSCFGELSIDAEGRLRTPHPEDRLDLEATQSYVKQAFRLLA